MVNPCMANRDEVVWGFSRVTGLGVFVALWSRINGKINRDI